MKQNIVATAIVDVNVKNIETGASAPVLVVPSVVEGVEVAQATKEVGSLKNIMFYVSAIGPNKVSIVMEAGQEMPKGSILMSSEDIKETFKGFRIFATEVEGEFLGIFFGEGLSKEDKNNWLRWLGLLAQESCKALWASVVKLLTEINDLRKEKGFLEALKALWKRFLDAAKAACVSLWETLVSLWERFMNVFKKANEVIQEPVVAPEVVA